MREFARNVESLVGVLDSISAKEKHGAHGVTRPTLTGRTPRPRGNIRPLCSRASVLEIIFMLILFLAVFSTGASAALPEPLPGWRIEVVAQAPQLKHPTVVACAPDGRVFVAEDPMDISLPKADAAEGRILCFHPDGRMTVFAEKLYAVFGLQYLEGRLYVLHNPKFSVFEDDNGMGRNRRELIEQTLPDPSALNWNDHVPANFRLAMDGFFYVASGDKGLHGAKGTDGSRADLFTGGIFRIRPDGTGLGVVSHGVRNILDVAVNSEDEMFTYDNTDEHDWMGRFTHMVEAGFYGYPHDFIPKRPYTLWMMDDYGAGAACGVFANNEDGLPPEYHGNVFLSDFGKRQLMRVRVAREGGSYRTISKEDLFPNPPGDFRPVGITLGPDGRSIYICDWQHRDEKSSASVGRLLKMTWTGKDQSVSKPAWYLPAATRKEFEATTAGLLAGLSHPSHSVRLTAQRRLAERKATKDLLGLLREKKASVQSRIHAIWALDAIESGRSVRKEMLEACEDSEPAIRRQAARALGGRRAIGAVPVLTRLLKDPDASVRFQSATALGRIGEGSAVTSLLPALEETDLFVRFAVFTALNRIGTNSPASWPAVVKGLESDKAMIREGTGFALRETYDLKLLETLTALFRSQSKPAVVRRAALELIVALHHQKPGWKGEWWAYHPALQKPPARTEPWTGTSLVLTTLRDGLRENDADLRRACINGLASARDTNAGPALLATFPRETESASRATILRALGAMKVSGALELASQELTSPQSPETTAAAISAVEQIGGGEAAGMLIDFLGSPGAEPALLVDAIAALGNLGAKSAAGPIERLAGHGGSAVRAASVNALGRLQGENSLAMLENGLRDLALEVRLAVVRALSDLKSSKAVPALLTAYRDPELKSEAFAAIARTPDERSIEVLLEGLSSKNPAQRNAAHLAIRNISEKVFKNVESKAGTLSSQALTELRQIYAGNKKAEEGPLFAREIKQLSLDEYMEAAVKIPGDPVRGRKLFNETSGMNCVACHRVAGEGSDIGPDLTGVGAQFDRRALAESILYPSKTVREGYQQMIFTLTDDEEISGVVKGETSEVLTLRDSSGREHKFARTKIKSRKNSPFSLMPEGLQTAASLEEFADLIAYLTTLKPK